MQELLPVIDAFEAAAGQVKAETEGEQRIAASYQVLSEWHEWHHQKKRSL